MRWIVAQPKLAQTEQQIGGKKQDFRATSNGTDSDQKRYSRRDAALLRHFRRPAVE